MVPARRPAWDMLGRMSTRNGDPDPAPTRPRDARQHRIVEHVVEHGSASLTELASLAGVSLMTVHRDVDELARRGLLRKFRGGVSAQPSTVFESNVEYRLGIRTAQKAAIAARARGYVEPGMSVLLDDSTSVFALAKLLGEVGPLTVVTNYLRAVEMLKGFEDVRLIGLGGEYSATHDAFQGISCVEAIERISVDVVFVSTSAMTATMTFHQEPEIVMVKRAMLRGGALKVLLMDSSKMPRSALHRLAPLSDFDRLIVDGGTPPELVTQFRESVAVDIAEP